MHARLGAIVATVLVAVAACGSTVDTATVSNPSPSPTPELSSRPASPAVVSIVQPAPGPIPSGSPVLRVAGGQTTVHVIIHVSGATIVKQTSTHIVPTEGHVHLYLDNNLIYMNYTLEQDVPVQPGTTYSLRAEFVASDHFPFNPQVFSDKVVFSVQ